MSKSIFISIHSTKARVFIPGVLFLLMTVSACKNDPKDINALIGKNQMREDRAKDVTFIYSTQGKVKARIFAHDFIHNEDATPPYADFKNGMKAEFYNDSGAVTSTLTAGYARYYEKEGNVLIRDSVVIVSKKGEQLNTEELIWNQKIAKFFTEKFVKITTPTQVTYGDGLEANQDFTEYQIKNLKGTVQVSKTEVPQ
jgi:LPS export ABC transporter protein LptC